MNGVKKFIPVLLLLSAVFLIQKFIHFPSISNPFKSKAVSIDETPILIKEIKSIGQLITYTSYDEVVVDSVIITNGAAFVRTFNKFSPVNLPSADKKLVLIAKGKVLAGTDLSLLNDTSIFIKADSVWLSIPKAKIIDAIVNPSDFETFSEQGKWTDLEVTLLKLKGRRKLTERALSNNLLAKADVKARDILTKFLENAGYKFVRIR